MTISEKVAYLKGLAEGLALDPKAKETKVIDAIIEVLTDMAKEFEFIDEDLDEIAEEVEAINDELSAIDEYLSDDDDDDDFDFNFFDDDDDDEDCDCPGCSSGDFSLKVDCPACDGEIKINEVDLISGLAVCTICGEKLEFEYDDDDDDDFDDFDDEDIEDDKE
jgi:hypothetical protein